VVIVRRREAHTFAGLPAVGFVERTFARISNAAAPIGGYERLPDSHVAMVLWAVIVLVAQ
jgi:hypothetical protein